MERVLGADDATTLTAYSYLAATYSALWRHEAAVGVWQPLLPTLEQCLGHGHPETVAAYHYLASAYRCLERYDDEQRVLARSDVARLPERRAVMHPRGSPDENAAAT